MKVVGDIRGASAVGRMTVICALLALGVYVAAKAAGQDAARSGEAIVFKADAVACDRNQVQRTYDRVDELQVRRIVFSIHTMKDSHGRPPQAPLIANAYFQIVNCTATYAKGQQGVDPIYLQGADERCFIHLVVSHYFVARAPVTDPKVLRRIC